MKCSVISLVFVLITGISAQQNFYHNLFGSFGSVLDSKNIFLKTVVSTITTPFRIPENQQSLESRSSIYMESPAGLTQQAVPLNTPASLGSDMSALGQLANNPQVLENHKRQLPPVPIPPNSDQVSPLSRGIYPNSAQVNQQGNVIQDVSSPSHSDIAIPIRLLSAPQTTSVPVYLANDQITELRSLILKLLTQKYAEVDTKVPLAGQTTTTGNAETSTSPSSPTLSSVLAENMEQSMPSLSQADPVANNDQSTS